MNSLIHCCKLNFYRKKFGECFNVIESLFQNQYLACLVFSYIPDAITEKRHFRLCMGIENYWIITVWWNMFNWDERKEYWTLQRRDRYEVSNWFFELSADTEDEWKQIQFQIIGSVIRDAGVRMVQIHPMSVTLENRVYPTCEIRRDENGDEVFELLIYEYMSDV